jgi:DNA-binding XRE family transcriptional regulator
LTCKNTGAGRQQAVAHPLDWENLERELNAAGVSPEEIEAGARRLLAQARGHQLAETRKQLGLGQKQTAAAMGVSVAPVSQIEHGEVTSFEVIARYVEAPANWAFLPLSESGDSHRKVLSGALQPSGHWLRNRSGDRGVAVQGSVTVNTAPPSGWLPAWICPPCSCAFSEAIARPRPLPSERARAVSAL